MTQTQKRREVQLIDGDCLNDLQHAAVGEDGLHLEGLDTLVEPGDV